MPITTEEIQPRTAERLQLRLFGEFVAREGNTGQEVTPRGRKARAILAYLALTNRNRATREVVAELLWSDRGEEQARASLRQSLAELRKALGLCADAIEITRDTMLLNAGLFESDASMVIAAARDGKIAEVAALLQHIDSGLLRDLEGLSPAFDDWLHVERATQHNRLITTLLDAAEGRLTMETAKHVREIANQLERLDPGNEAVARLGMRADALEGNLASVHRRFRRLSASLESEFGVTPSSETQSAFSELTALRPILDQPELGAGAGSVSTGASTASSVIEPPVIIVAPVACIGGGEDGSAIASISTDEIMTALGRHRDIRVLAIDSSDLDRVADVCSTAVVTYLLSGTLRAVGRQFRLNVKLASNESGMLLWSEQIMIDEDAIDKAVDLIVELTVGAVAPVIERDLILNLPPRVNDTDHSYAVYARARKLARTGETFAEIKEAADLLESIVLRTPSDVRARLLLIQLYNTDFWQLSAGHDTVELRARALTLAREASALDPHHPVVHLRLGWCHLRGGNWAESTQAFENALRLGPNNARVINAVGSGLAFLGEIDQAQSLIARAFAINPFPPPDYHADAAVVLALAERTDEAEEQFRGSTHAGLHYHAVRLANAAGRQPIERVSKLAAELRLRFSRVWRGASPLDDEAIIEWTERFMPLRQRAHRRLIDDGLARGLAS
jgi:DNA-binding SARP family transcriptional activator